jgi:hypothetical protein
VEIPGLCVLVVAGAVASRVVLLACTRTGTRESGAPSSRNGLVASALLQHIRTSSVVSTLVQAMGDEQATPGVRVDVLSGSTEDVYLVPTMSSMCARTCGAVDLQDDRSPQSYFAFIVGVDKYADAPLEGCCSDASSMRDCLAQGGYPEGHVVLLQNPALAEFESRLHGFLGIVPRDRKCTLVFHFSGHGVVASGRLQLLAADSSTVSGELLW